MFADFKATLGGCGGILISHRLGSAAIADRILVLQGGAIAEEGSHAALLRRNGIYARMWEAQSQWYKRDEDEKIPIA